MKYYANGGFYDKAIHGEDGVPAGAVEITDEYWRELLNGQSAGLVISKREDGYPILTEPDPVPLDEQKTHAISRLWEKWKYNQQSLVDAEDLTLAVSLAQNGSVKGQAVRDWVMQYWRKYYAVRDAVEAADDEAALKAISLEPDPEDRPPYRVRELNNEAAMKEKVRSVTQKIKELFSKKQE